MDITEEVRAAIGGPESERLEYKAVLPPASTMALLIGSLANSGGGLIVLGATEWDGQVSVHGLQDEFRAAPIVTKALSLLSSPPLVHSQYVDYRDIRVFAIKVEGAAIPVSLEGREYIRVGTLSVPRNAEAPSTFKDGRVRAAHAALRMYETGGTSSKRRLLRHYESLLSILDSAAPTPSSSAQSGTESAETKVLRRVLFSSFADNFETYLSDVLYEIYLARPETLRSEATVTVKEVLECADIQEFIGNYARKKIAKLQRGSVRGFVAENRQISALGILDAASQEEIEKTLQIRHLFSHRNGIVDAKFQGYFPSAFLNDEFEMPLEEFLRRCGFLAQVVDTIDRAAIRDYGLATFG